MIRVEREAEIKLPPPELAPKIDELTRRREHIRKTRPVSPDKANALLRYDVTIDRLRREMRELSGLEYGAPDAEGNRRVLELLPEAATALRDASKADAVQVAEQWEGDQKRYWWSYKDTIYSTNDRLTADELALLADEISIKRAMKLERAAAITAQSGVAPREERISKAIKVAVWRRDQGRCSECGSKENLEFDHIIPRSLGGSHTERNVQLLCADCNRRKGAVLGGEERH